MAVAAGVMQIFIIWVEMINTNSLLAEQLKAAKLGWNAYSQQRLEIQCEVKEMCYLELYKIETLKREGTEREREKNTDI